MSNQNQTNLSEERKKMLRKDLSEGLEGLKELFISAIKLIINVIDSIPQSKDSTLASYTEVDSSSKKVDSSLSLITNGSEHTEPESVNVSVALKEESFKDTLLKGVKQLTYPILGIISTAALTAGVIKIDPLIQWAKLQNECIATSKSIETTKSNSLSSRVMTCNGGHAN